MNKKVGILLAIIATLGIVLCLQQVVSSHSETKPETHQVAKPQTETSQQSSSTASQTAESAEKSASSASTHTSSDTTSTSTTTKPLPKSVRKESATKAHTTTKASRVHAVTNQKLKSTAKSHSDASKRTVYVKVSGYKKTLYAHKLPVTRKTTVFSLLKATKLKISYTRMPHVYVKAINGLTENDIKVGSGWKYNVNGKFIETAADSKKVKAGDTVHWYFAVNGY